MSEKWTPPTCLCGKPVYWPRGKREPHDWERGTPHVCSVRKDKRLVG